MPLSTRVEVALQRGAPRYAGRAPSDRADQRAHATHHLDRGRAVVADLVEREDDEVVPGRHGVDEAQASPVASRHAPAREPPPAEADEEVLDLVEGLDRGGRVVDRRRQRADRDVDEQADRVLRVLLERPARGRAGRSARSPRSRDRRGSPRAPRRSGMPSTTVSPTATAIVTTAPVRAASSVSRRRCDRLDRRRPATVRQHLAHRWQSGPKASSAGRRRSTTEAGRPARSPPAPGRRRRRGHA